MSSRSLLWSVGSLAATSLIAPAVAKGSSGSYQLHESWQGEKFLDYFEFFDQADPTNGFVTYANQSYAESSGLIDITSSGSFYMGVDHKTKLSPEGPGRDSVRIESKKYYDEGLYVIDLAHMPGSICGTWPAFWSVGPDWPHDGEIDIIEGVNKHEANEIVLHTSGSCDVGGDHEMLGDMTSSECGDASGTIGCVVKGNQGSSGDPFNKNGGGVYAMEWTADFLKIWYFSRGDIPKSITNGKPDTSAFGTPMAHLQGSCDFHERFKSQKFILDTTFCGDWAGGVFGDSGCPVKDPSNPIQSCVNYVAENPEAFKEAYWEINSIKLYQIGTSSNTPAETSPSAASQVESATHAVSQAASTSTTQQAAATTKAAGSKTDTAIAHTASNPAAEVTSAAPATTEASGAASSSAASGSSSSGNAGSSGSSESSSSSGSSGSSSSSDDSNNSGSLGSSSNSGSSGSSEGSAGSQTVSRSTLYVTETTTVCALTKGTSAATGIPAGQSGADAESGDSSVVPTAAASQPAPEGTSGVIPSQVPDTPADSQSQDNVPSVPTASGAQPSSPTNVNPVGGSRPSNPPSPPQSITVSPSGFVPAPAPAPTSAPPAGDSPAGEDGSAPGGSPGAGSGSGSGSGASGNSGFSGSSASPIPSATTPISPLFTGAASKLSLSTSGFLGALALAFLA